MKTEVSAKWSWPFPLICSQWRGSWNLNCQGCVICVPWTVTVQVTLPDFLAKTWLKTWACLFSPHFYIWDKKLSQCPCSGVRTVNRKEAVMGREVKPAIHLMNCTSPRQSKSLLVLLLANPASYLFLHILTWITCSLKVWKKVMAV